MFHGVSGIRRVWTKLPLLVLLAHISAVLTASADEPSRLMVYLEIPRTSVSTEISLTGLTLLDENRTESLPLELDTLESEGLGGLQVLLAHGAVSPGRYSSVTIGISSIVGHVGVAEVNPGVDSKGISVPVELDIEPGQTGTLFLKWSPTSVDSEKEFHSPVITRQNPELPPLGSLAFATSRGSGSVMIINRLTRRVVGALGVDEDPRGLAYSPAEHTLFVALADQDAIAVVDVLSLRLVNTVPLQFGDDPTRLMMSHDGTTLYVLGAGSRTLTALSVWSLQQQFRMAVGDGPRSMAQDPISGQLFVACEDEGRVQVIDPVTGTVERSLTMVSAPVEIVIGEQSRRLYLGGAAQRVIRSFNLASEESDGDQNICGPVAGLAVNPRNQRLYASVPSCRNLAVIRPDLGVEFGSISLPDSPGLLSFEQDFGHLWVALPRAGQIAVCNVNTGVLDAVIEVGPEPYEVLIP